MDKKEILKIAGIYMMLNIGAGFTSGQEILQFFSGFGWSGFLVGIITFIIMSYGGESIIDAGWLCRENSRISVFEYFGGKYIGSFYNIIMPVLSFGGYITMIAGSGAVLEQFFGIPNMIGRMIVCSLSVMSLFLKFQYIAKYLSIIGRGVVFIIFSLSLAVVLKGLGNISNVSQFVQDFPVRTGSDTFYGAGILYGGVIILASSQFLFDTGMNLNKRNSGVFGVLCGSFFFVVVALTVHFAISLYYDQVYNLPILTIYFADLISKTLAFALTVLIFIAMYSASTVSLWSVSNIIRKKYNLWKIRYVTIIISLGVGGLLLSSISFGALVNFLYPLSGFFGMLLVLLITYNNRRLVYRINKEEDSEEENKEEK